MKSKKKSGYKLLILKAKIVFLKVWCGKMIKLD